MNNIAKEAVGVGVTVARLGIAEWVARRVRAGESIYLPLASFVAADILDGVLLRRVGMDTPVRRAADGIVDQLSIARVAYETAQKHPETRKYIAALALRVAAVGVANALHLRKTGEVTKAGNKQRTMGLAAAAFASVASRGQRAHTEVAGVAMLAVGAITGEGYFRGIGVQNDGAIRDLGSI